MARRLKTKSKIKSEKSALEREKSTNTKSKRPESKLFEVFLVVFIAILGISILLLSFSLTSLSGWTPATGASVLTKAKNVSKNVSAKKISQTINDPGLDFELTVPPGIGDWFYKTGNIKSPVDDALSDQYVQIFVRLKKTTGSKNFEDQNKSILTIKKFTADEWKKLEKGCQNDNLLYCEAAGTKVAEKGESVYAYTKTGNCPKDIEAQCRLADKLIESFSLK
jgi:hypothetical protein